MILSLICFTIGYAVALILKGANANSSANAIRLIPQTHLFPLWLAVHVTFVGVPVVANRIYGRDEGVAQVGPMWAEPLL